MLRKSVLFATCVAVALMVLFPPFHYRFSQGRVKELGYSFIGSPPVVNPVEADVFGTVNIPLLFIQISGVLVFGAVGYSFTFPKDHEFRMRALP